MPDQYGVTAEEFIDWPTYQASRSDVDPVEAYADYTNVVMPNHARAMGATPEQVKETQALFQQRVPPPTPKPKDEGFLSNAAKAVGSELGSLGRTAKAGAAVAEGDPLKLAKLTAEETKAAQEVNAPQAKFREGINKDGTLWEFLSSSVKSAVQEPEGAFDSTLQVLTGFIPYVTAGVVGGAAGSAVPIVGNVVGVATAMGLTAADLEAGSKGIMLMQRAAAADGVDLNDETAVKKWIKDGGAEKVFGPAIKAALTNGAITALTMGVAGAMGGRVTTLLKEGDVVSARVAQGAELGTVVGGFGGASAAGNIAAGEPVDEKDMFVNSLTLLVPGALGARSKFAGARKSVEVPKTETKEVPKTETKSTGEPTEAELRAMFNEEPKPVEQTPKAKTEVPIEQRATAEQVEAIKPFDEISIEDKAVATAVVQDVAKEALNEHIKETTKQVKDEVAQRKAARAAAVESAEDPIKRAALEVAPPDTAIEPAVRPGDVATERSVGPAEDAALQQDPIRQAAAGPVDRGRSVVDEESVHAGTEAQSGGDQQTGSLGRGSEPVATEQKLPGVNAGRKKSSKSVSPFRTKEEAVRAKNPLYVGKDETAKANRKAEQDMQEALRREREGDLDSVHRLVDQGQLHDSILRDLANGQGSADRALETLSKSGNSPLTRVLAHALRMALKGTDLPIEFREGMTNKKGEIVAGRYSPSEGKILLSRTAGGQNSATLLHELVHAATVRAIDFATSPEQHRAVRQLETMLHRARVAAYGRQEEFYGLRKRFNEDGSPNWQTEVKEFVAEAFSNSDFQKFLADIHFDQDPLARQTVWQAFKQVVSKIVSQQLPGRERTVLHNALVQSLDLFEVPKREIAKKDLVDLDSIARKQDLIAFKAMDKDGPGDVVGRDENGVVKYRGWKNNDGTYRVYEVTPDEPMGTKASKQIVDAEELPKFLEDAGVQTELRTKGFDQPPGNNKSLVTRWLDGKLAYAAVENPDGTWRAKIGEDILSPTADYGFRDFKTKAEAEAAANVVSTHDSKAKSDAAKVTTDFKDLIATKGEASNVVTVGEPGFVAKVLGDRNAPINYVAGVTKAWMERIGLRAPEGMQLHVEFLMKNSDIGYQTETMMKQEGGPLLEKTRKLMDSSPLLSGKDGPAMLDNIVRYLVVDARAKKLLPRYTEETKWADPADHSQGFTKFYERGLEKQRKAKDFLADVNKQDTTLVPQVLRFLKEDWKPFSDRTIDHQYQTGRISKETADLKKAAYDIYAPLREQGRVTGKAATGQSEGGKNLLEQIIDQRVQAIIEGVDNKTMNLLDTWARILDYRNEDGSKIFRLEPVDREHLKHNVETGEISVTSVVNPNKSVVWYRDGVPMRMEINNEGLLKALDRFHGAEMNIALRKALATAGFYTRVFSVLHTSLSPAFALRNFQRDYGTILTMLPKEISYTQFHKSLLTPAVWEAAFRHGYKEAITLTGADPLAGNTEGAKLARLVDANRPLIEHRYRYGTEQISQEASTSLQPSIGARIGEYLAPTNGKLINFWSGATHFLEGVNRIAVQHAAMESGLNAREAATLGKLTSGNFEQRGAAMPYLTPNYPFSGAKMTGARMLMENLGATKIQGPEAGGLKKAAVGLLGGKLPTSANARTVRAAQLGIALGLGVAYLNYKSSDKDKDGRTLYGKRNEYQLDSYMHIPGLNIDLLLPQEVGNFYVLGSSLGDRFWGDRSGAASSPMIRFTTSVINNFNPGGTSMHDPVGTKGDTGDYFARLVLPGWATPPYDIYTNRTSFGATVNSQRDSKTIPPEMQGAATASPFARIAAQGLHQGGFDTSPKAVDHVIKSVFGQQKGTYNAILDGDVGALLHETVKSFHQEIFPGTVKNDFDQINKDVMMEATRQKGSPLKRSEGDEMVQTFKSAEKQLDRLKAQWNKATDPEIKKAIDAKQNDIRLNALKKYNKATGVTN